ncbi:MAG: signal peptidase I [Clostridiales bacterium]|jgi:signal peptidase|nr:signal peptidase I [Clostridiales bacterium]
MKTLEELNQEFKISLGLISPESSVEEDISKPDDKSRLSDIFPDFILPLPDYSDEQKIKRIPVIICIAVCCIIFIGIIVLPSALGVSWFHVDSPSMQSEIPEGSLIVVKRTDPSKIQVGDVITYRRSDGKSITHKVEQIIPYCGGSDSIGFRTKGTENAASDQYIVLQEHVIGVVRNHIPGLGRVLGIVSTILLIIVIAALALTVAIFIIWQILKKRTQKEYSFEQA